MARKPCAPPPAPSNPDDLDALALELKLTTIRAELPRLLGEAEAKTLSYTAFAKALLQAEARARRERRRERAIKRARLGCVQGLDGFDFSIREKLVARVVQELLECEWARTARNLLLIGGPGLGKTRVARALVHAACLQGMTALATITADLLDDLQAARADGSYARVFARYARLDVLLLDEFGYQGFSAQATNDLFRLVAARHGVHSTILCSNVGFRKWVTLFPSEGQAVAAVDRLIDDATILRFTGRSCRRPHPDKPGAGSPTDDGGE